MSASSKRVLFAIVACGALLRLSGLGVHSFWIDEAGTMYVAHADDIALALRHDRHPPLSFLLFRGWSKFVGESDAWLRLAPALASIASLCLLARLAHQWLLDRAVWIAVAIAAVSPLELWIAREVRMYAFVECAALVAYVAAWEHLKRPRKWLILAVFVASVVATGMHYFGAFVGPTVALVSFSHWRDAGARRRIAALSIAATLGALAWLPWFASVYRDQAAVGAAFLSNFGLRTIAEFPARLIVPTSDMLPAWCVRSAYAAAILVTVACLVFAVELIRERRRGEACAALVLATPPACALLAAIVGPLSFLARYFAASMPGAALVVASGLASLRWKWLRGLATATLLALLIAISFGVHSRNDREDWRTACGRVAADFRPGDRILSLTHLSDGYSQAPLVHYWRDEPELIRALTTLEEANTTIAEPGRLHVIYRETRYVAAEYRDLASRRQIVTSESFHGAIHRMIFE